MSIDVMDFEQMKNIIMGKPCFDGNDRYTGRAVDVQRGLNITTDTGRTVFICGNSRRIKNGLLMCCSGRMEKVAIDVSEGCVLCKHSCKKEKRCAFYEEVGI